VARAQFRADRAERIHRFELKARASGPAFFFAVAAASDIRRAPAHGASASLPAIAAILSDAFYQASG
jgi:hypothetical protein